MVEGAESETRQGNSRWLWILDRIAGPALASASRAERARVLSLGGTLLVGIASFSAATLFAPLIGAPALVPVIAPLAVSSTLLLWLLRRSGSVDRVADAFLASLFAFFALITLITGGSATAILFMGSCIPVTGGLLRGPGSATFWAGSVTLVILGTFLARSLLGPETFPSPGAYSIETSFVGALLMAVALCGTVAGHAASWRALREEADEAAERQLHAEKQRKALGREFDRLRLLAGGVAHDFNNLLQTIGGNAELARDELPEDSPARLPLGELELATERAAALVRELLAFAGHGSPHIAPLELGEVAAEAVGLARPLVAEEIRIEFLHPVTEIWTRADRDQTLGALLNLIKNAGDAQSGGGRIEVSTGVGKLGTSGLEEQLGAPDPEASEFGYIEVQDAGGGIPDEVRTRMFDPFYTTRRGGRGLGLPAVLALAENLRGALEFGSRGDGTAFRILLPHTRVPDLGETQRPIPTLSLEDRLVLVVDDDERVRRVVRRMLENLGARVIDAESGFDALHRFRDEVMQIDAALIDLAMPEIDGEELLYALRDVRGDLPILIITGQASGGYEHLAELPEVEYLQKPFTAASMTRAIEILLAPENDDDVFR